VTPEMVVHLAREAVIVVLLVCGPLLGVALVVGFVVSLLQAVTQIQEQTLVFIPKIVAVFVSVALFGPWMLRQLLAFTHEMFNQIRLLTQ